MTSENLPDNPLPDSRTHRSNALIAKIALFLNYIGKQDHERITGEMASFENTHGTPPDILQFMRDHRYLTKQECSNLKKAFACFIKTQEDVRFGELCIEFDFLTRGNLTLALEEQQQMALSGRSIRIGDLLVDAGMISESQKTLVLQKQKLTTSTKTRQEPCNTNQSVLVSIDTTGMQQINTPPFVFYIQSDALKAYVAKDPSFSHTRDAMAQLREALEKNGIIYGLADPEKINAFLLSENDTNKLFKLACGTPPVDGEDALIEYQFELDYLKPGRLKEDGTIDFKERGQIPFVCRDTVIAVKTPPRHGKHGVNIYGDTIDCRAALDQDIQPGRGVRLSPDQLQAFSEVDGNPGLSADGVLSVNDAYFIEGDVDFTTGHVKFDKNIYITGAVKSGFRVEGINVMANSVDGGMIKARGDVLVKNGITESSIRAKGNINAAYIHRSRIHCLRDLKVTREIVDTEAALDGMCLLKSGRMYTSVISAKGGAVIQNIGSEKSRPSVISVGTARYMEQELKRIDKQIEKFQNALEESTLEKSRLEKELEQTCEIMDNLMAARKKTQAAIDVLKHGDKPGDITLFQNSLIEATEKIETLSLKKMILKKKVLKITGLAEENTQRVTSSIEEKFKIKRLEKNTPSKPVLDVGGTVFPGNRVYGKHSHIIINRTQTRVRIMEMGSATEDSTKTSWEMVITTL